MVPKALALLPWSMLEEPIKNGRTKATNIVPETIPPESKAMEKKMGGVKYEKIKINTVIGTINHKMLTSNNNLSIEIINEIITEVEMAINIYFDLIIPFVTSSICFNNIKMAGSVKTKMAPNATANTNKR